MLEDAEVELEELRRRVAGLIKQLDEKEGECQALRSELKAVVAQRRADLARGHLRPAPSAPRREFTPFRRASSGAPGDAEYSCPDET